MRTSTQTKTVSNTGTSGAETKTFTFTIPYANEILYFGITSIGGYANNVGVAYFSYTINGNSISWSITHENPARHGAGNSIPVTVTAIYK